MDQIQVRGQVSRELIRMLKLRIAIFTSVDILGGFRFSGIVVDVRDDVVILSNAFVSFPGGSSFDIGSVVINLNTLAAVVD